MEMLLSTREVAERMSLSVRQVRQLISRRHIRYVCMGGRCMVPEAAIAEFFQLNTVEPIPMKGDAPGEAQSETTYGPRKFPSQIRSDTSF